MKKNLLCFIMAFFIASSMLFSSVSEAVNLSQDNTYNYGKVIKSGINSIGFDQVLQIKICNTDGEETVYDVNDRILINDEQYIISKMNDIYISQLIPNDVYAKFALNESGKINVLYFNNNMLTYKKVTYDSVNKRFTGMETSIANLPIYYIYNGYISKAHLDEYHIYDINVYDYAVEIVDMQAFDELYTIKDFYVSCNINSSFSYGVNINASIEHPENDIDMELAIMIYDETSILIRQKYKYISGDYISGYEDVSCNFDFPNISASYKVHIWLEENGTRVSPIYTNEFKTVQFQVLYGKVIKSIINTEAFDKTLQLFIRNPDGVPVIYNVNDLIFINDERYIISKMKDDDLSQLIPNDIYVKYALNEAGKIRVVDSTFSDSFSALATVFDNYYENGQVIVELELDKISNNCNILLPVYDSNGTLINIGYTGIKSGDKFASVSCSCTEKNLNQYTAKVLFWDDFLKPICYSIPLNLSDIQE